MAHLLCFVFFSFATCLFTESGAFAICSKRTSRDRHVRIWPTIYVILGAEKQPPNVMHAVQNFHNTKTFRIKALFMHLRGKKRWSTDTRKKWRRKNKSWPSLYISMQIRNSFKFLRACRVKQTKFNQDSVSLWTFNYSFQDMKNKEEHFNGNGFLLRSGYLGEFLTSFDCKRLLKIDTAWK